jgi:acyl carrier protein
MTYQISGPSTVAASAEAVSTETLSAEALSAEIAPGNTELGNTEPSSTDSGSGVLTSAPAATVEELTAWLIARVAVYLEREPEDIDPREPLAEYGLDSIASLSLCGDVEEDFGIILDPTAAWDYPTPAAFAEHLFKELASAAGRP